MGYLYRRGRIWWAKYYVNGAPRRESTGTEKQEEARRFLKLREGAVGKGAPVAPRLDRILYDEAAQDLRGHYRTTGARDLGEAEFRLKHLDSFFAGRRIATIGPADARAYVAQRQREKASNGTINRELAVLNRMRRLAYENGKLLRLPIIRRLQESGPRQGFFGEVEFLALHEALPIYLRPLAAFAYTTGWRREEVRGLTWSQVDLQAGTVRLEPGTTKNQEGRTVVLPEPLRALVAEQWGRAVAIVRKENPEATPREVAERIIPSVFHRKGNPIRSFRRAWKSACKKAGQPGRIPHDFRRTAVRNIVRRGIPERVAMTLTGHKTRSVFERYNIVSQGDLREAGRRLTGMFSGISAHFAVDAATASV